MAIDISKRPDGPIRKFTIPQKHKSGITSDLLKFIAIIAMTVDHIAWLFVETSGIAGQAMHFIGRLTAPIMCFMIAEGYHKTHNVKKYALRLGIFALISHLPYVFFSSGRLYLIHQTSVMFTLFLGLVALIVRDSPKYEPAVKNMIILVICLISMVGDWGAIAVIWILIFSACRFDRKMQMKYFCAVSALYILLDFIYCATMGQWYHDLFQLGVFLAIPLLINYNGVRKVGKAHKWLFYIYYPAHLVILSVIRYMTV